MATIDVEATSAEPMTCERVRVSLRRLDSAIDCLEGRSGQLDAQAFRAYMALRQRRIALRLLLVARRVELGKRVVDFDRWRFGYQPPSDAPAAPAPLARRG